MQRELEALQEKLRALTMTKTLHDSERVVIQVPCQSLRRGRQKSISPQPPPEAVLNELAPLA